MARVIVLIGHTHRPSNSLPIEGVVAIGSGISARSVTLLAFGIDSVVELVSAGVLIWRLTVELRHGLSFAEAVEHMASRIGGVLLFALAFYVVLATGWSLWTRQGQDFSWPGLGAPSPRARGHPRSVRRPIVCTVG